MEPRHQLPVAAQIITPKVFQLVGSDKDQNPSDNPNLDLASLTCARTLAPIFKYQGDLSITLARR